MTQQSNPRLVKAAATAVIALATPFVAAHEGLRLNAYLDVIGKPTICYGETLGVKLGDKATQTECDEKLRVRLQQFADAVDRSITYPMSPVTHAALTSFAYNVGMANFDSSSIRRLMNAGQPAAACNRLPLWNKARAAGVLVVWPGLTSRRAAERALCLEGLQ